MFISQTSRTFCGTFNDAGIVQTGFPQTGADAPAVARRDTLNEKSFLTTPLAKPRGKTEAIFQNFEPLIYGDIRKITKPFCKKFAKYSDTLVYTENSIFVRSYYYNFILRKVQNTYNL